MGAERHVVDAEQLQFLMRPGASLMAQMAKNLPATWETHIQFLSHEDPLEKEMATHSSILAWRIPWTEEPGRIQPLGSQRVRHDLVTNTFHFHFEGRRNISYLILHFITGK